MAVTIGLQVIPQHGDYEPMKRAWLEADELGVDRIYNWDHFYPLSGDPEGKHFESLTIQAAMAAVTKRAEISSLVICNSYRNPQLLADMARTIDHISGGRFVLGIGSGWNRREFDAFGFPYDRRVSRFEEALAIIAPLLREGRTTFHGQFYDVDDCVLDPRPVRDGGPPIRIGMRRSGGGFSFSQRALMIGRSRSRLRSRLPAVPNS